MARMIIKINGQTVTVKISIVGLFDFLKNLSHITAPAREIGKTNLGTIPERGTINSGADLESMPIL